MSGPSEDPPLLQLPPELLEPVIALLDAVADVLSLRLACRALRQPAADAIRTLSPAGPELELPAEAWSVFRRAYQLRIGHSEFRVAGTVFASLPARLTSISCGRLWNISRHDLAHTITSISAAGTLEVLVLLGNVLLPASADLLVRGLPSLRRLSLVVWGYDGAPGNWRPALPPGLTSLELHWSGGRSRNLDLSVVAALPELRELNLRGSGLLQGSVAALAQLQRLTRLEIIVGHADADCWQVISQLPGLRQVVLVQLTLPAAGEQEQGGATAAAPVPQLTNLTSLQTRGGLCVGSRPQPAGPPAQPAFSLAQAMPRLQHLELWYKEGQRLESWQALLQGHPQLCSLELGHSYELDAQGRQQLAALLQSLPRLAQLKYANYVAALGPALLAAAAALPGLRELSLEGAVSSWPLRSMQLLGAGACTGLQQLELRGTGVGPAALAALLRGGLPQLQTVRLDYTARWECIRWDSAQLSQHAQGPPSTASDAELLRLAQAIADSGELVQALAGSVAQQQAPTAAAPERPRTRAAAAADRAEEQQLEGRCEPALQRLAARLRRGAAGRPLLREQEAAALLQRVRQQLVLQERLAQQLEGSSQKGLKFLFRGCSIQVSDPG